MCSVVFFGADRQTEKESLAEWQQNTVCWLNVASERKLPSVTKADTAALPQVAEDEAYDDIISLYDVIDDEPVSEQVRGYEALNQTTLAAILHTVNANDYAGLGAVRTDDSRKSTEHVEMKNIDVDNNHRDAVSKQLSLTHHT